MNVFMDIDGVLAYIGHRLHYQRDKDYKKFYSPEELAKDLPYLEGLTLAEAFFNMDSSVQLVFVTGRPERTRKATEDWLDAHFYDYDYIGERVPILMRKDGDYRPSDVVKVESIRKFYSDLYSETDLPEQLWGGIFIDDDPKNVIAIEKAFPNMVGMLHGTKRLKERD